MFKNIPQMARCPFNKAHTFTRDKLIFHINRCKDKQNVIKNFEKCKFNPTHYIPKEEIQMHECCCPSRNESINMVKKLEITYRKALREPRQRSRQRERGQVKDSKFEERDAVKHDHDDENETTLEDCKECLEILRAYKEKIMASNKCQKLKKFILKYYDLDNEDYQT